MSRIVLTTWGSLGDLHPYMALALELKRRGHDPLIATMGAWREHVERAGLRFFPAGPGISADQDVARMTVERLLHPQQGPEYLFKGVLGPAMRQTYDEVVAAVMGPPRADLLVTHQVPIVSKTVAETAKVRWVSAVLLPISFLSAYDPATPPQAPWLQPITALHPSIARGLNSLGKWAMRSWPEPVYQLRAELGLARNGNPIFEGQHSPDRVLALFSRVFAAKQPDYPPQTVITGFPFYDARNEKPASPELLRFLDSGEPPLLFTLGSAAVWIAGDFYAIAIAVSRALGRRALLLAGEDAARLRAEGLPDGITAVDYAPHGVVMPRALVNIHQGGVGTTAQALRAGRPMLVVPFGQDQPDNARRITKLGVGTGILRARFTHERAVCALREIIHNPSYAARAAETGAIVRSERGAEVACDEIEAVLAR
jgi:rhamnosyltransferase subunit B